MNTGGLSFTFSTIIETSTGELRLGVRLLGLVSTAVIEKVTESTVS